MGQGSVPAQSVLGAQTQGMLGYLIEQEPGNQLGNVREAYLDGEAGFENTASVW
jgi:carbamate kinase